MSDRDSIREDAAEERAYELHGPPVRPREPLAGEVRCGECHGEGRILIDTTHRSDFEPSEEAQGCRACEGSGCVVVEVAS